MADTYQQPYLDASVYSAAIKGEGGRVETAQRILDDAKRGVFQVVGSTLVIAEVVGAPRNERPMTLEQERVVDEYVFHGYITWVELDQSIALEARRIARQHGIKTADAIHLASAARGGADQLLRWDDKFRLTEGETYEGVLVREPYWAGQLPLDEAAS